jgi:hypothetical protein
MEDRTCSVDTGVHKREGNETFFKNANASVKLLQMKLVYPHLEDTSQRISKFIDSQPNATNGQGYEAKELCKRYTLNNVASCAFGLEGKCFEEDNSEFQQIAQQFMTPETWSTVKIFLMSLFPFLTNFISVK